MLVLGIGIGVVFASDEADSSGITTRFFGMGSYEFGQIVMGQYAWAKNITETNKGRLDHYWNQQGLLQIGVAVKGNKGLSMILAGEGAMLFPYSLPSDGSGFGFDYLQARFKWYPSQLEGDYSLGDADNPYLKLGVGYFPFKYNPDARNFGDYLLRINSYPQYLPTTFDACYTRLLGFHATSKPLPSLQADFLLTSETYLWPLRDFSLSLLVNYNLMKFADFGAGIMGARVFAVDDQMTNPPPGVQEQGCDFTFASTKLMFRVALDFKRFMPFEFWGPNDFRLYGEACLNGLKNYPMDSIYASTSAFYPGYNDILKRIPVSMGFNIPTFKVLDVLSLEAEWWDNNFANSYWSVYPTIGGYKELPNPTKYSVMLQQGHRIDPYGGAWHWSVYAKKTLFNNAKLVFQVARDHTILTTTLTGATNGDAEEAMDGFRNWGWMAKIEYGF